jgi:hypothetical protein
VRKEISVLSLSLGINHWIKKQTLSIKERVYFLITIEPQKPSCLAPQATL